MCYHRSFVVLENGKVLGSDRSDHHTDIRREYNIREEGFIGCNKPHAAVECVPVESLFQPHTYKKIMDQPDKPVWWTDDHWTETLNKLTSDFKRRTNADSQIYKAPGDLEIPYLESLEPDAVLIADAGTIYLDRVRHYRRVTVIAQRIVFNAGHVRSLEGCNFICDRFESNDPNIKKFLERKDSLVIRDSRRMYGYVDPSDMLVMSADIDLASTLKKTVMQTVTLKNGNKMIV